jgi:hypothetical protein
MPKYDAKYPMLPVALPFVASSWMDVGFMISPSDDVVIMQDVVTVDDNTDDEVPVVVAFVIVESTVAVASGGECAVAVSLVIGSNKDARVDSILLKNFGSSSNRF